MYKSLFLDGLNEFSNSLEEFSGEFSNLDTVTIFIPSVWRFSQLPPRIEAVNNVIKFLLSKSLKVNLSYDGSSMSDYVKKLDSDEVHLQDFTKTRYRRTDGIGERNVQKYGKQENLRIPILQKLFINSEIFEADAIIPIFSPHPSNVFFVNGCMSSFMSIVPTETKARILFEAKNGRHHDALVELFSLIYDKVLFSVYDFSKMFSWSGRGDVESKPNDSILISSDSVAGDSLVSTVFKWPKLSVKSIRVASSLGFGDGMLDEDLIHGTEPEIGKIKYPLPDKTHILFPLSLMTRFSIQIQENCTGCGECVYDCPNGSIAMDGETPKINNSMCVKCFVCIDACSEFALWIKRLP